MYTQQYITVRASTRHCQCKMRECDPWTRRVYLTRDVTTRLVGVSLIFSFAANRSLLEYRDTLVESSTTQYIY